MIKFSDIVHTPSSHFFRLIDVPGKFSYTAEICFGHKYTEVAFLTSSSANETFF